LVGGDHRRHPRARPQRGDLTGPSPVDRARTGTRHHAIVDPSGAPLAVSVTGGNRNDVTQLEPLIDGIGPVRGRRGRPRRRPDSLYGDRAYDHEKHRRKLRRRGVKPVIARRGTDHGSGLGRTRWVVERTFSWLHAMRRLRIRYEHSGALHLAFLQLGAAVVCARLLG
jgi:transposase